MSHINDRLRRPEPFGKAAFVLAVLALIMAITGAYGATASKSKSKGLTKAQVLALIKANSKPGPEGKQGPQGQLGPEGKAGPEGKPGPEGVIAASCPAATTLIRGLCYDTHSNPVASNLEEAAEACASKGGYLPTPMQLYSTREVLSLGSGTEPAKHQYTDDLYSNTTGGAYRTIVVDGIGAPEEYEPTAPSAYYCVYPLVR